MTKHSSDQPESQGSARLRAFTRQEREAGLHPAIASLRSRPKDREEANRKAAEYLRIARGRLA